MTQHTPRWLLVTVALLGIVLAAPVVGAHAADPTSTDTRPVDDATIGDRIMAGHDWNGTGHNWNGTVDDRAAWMEARMVDHMGPEGVAWMETRMGLPVDEMARWMAGGDHPMWDDDVPHVTDGEARHPIDGTHRGPDGEAHRVTDDGRWPTGVDRRGMGGGWGC